MNSLSLAMVQWCKYC